MRNDCVLVQCTVISVYPGAKRRVAAAEPVPSSGSEKCDAFLEHNLYRRTGRLAPRSASSALLLFDYHTHTPFQLYINDQDMSLLMRSQPLLSSSFTARVVSQLVRRIVFSRRFFVFYQILRFSTFPLCDTIFLTGFTSQQILLAEIILVFRTF